MNKKYIYNHTRISLLKDNIIRFEFVKNDHFTNEETLFTLKKKEEIFDLDIKVEEENCYFYLDDLKIVLNPNNPLDSIKIYLNDVVVYRYHFVANSGELPLPNKTPYIFPLMDTPRLIIPETGYDIYSDFIYEKDTKDLFLLICKKDYKLLRKQYISLTGTNDMPRLKTFGLFNSRYYPWSEKSAKEMIDKYRKNHIPLDNFVLDTDWRKAEKIGGVGYEVNKDLFPNIAKFFHYCHERNIEVMMNDHPNPINKKVNVLDKDEINYRKTNLTKFLNIGLDTWWYDRNWIISLKSISKRIKVETLGRFIYNDVTKDFLQGFSIDLELHTRPVTLTNITEIRNGKYEGISDSRSHTSAFQWSGDISSDLEDITAEVKNMIRCSNNMLAYYSSDIGGHTGNPSKNDFIRWYQYGALSPILRPHCTNSVVRYREPWVFGKKTLEIVKQYIYMRYHLLNVTYTNAFKHVYDGLGIFRPLYINYPNDKKAYKEATSYMLGDNILISPIEGEEKKKVEDNCYIGKVNASFYDNTNLKGKAILVKKLDKLDLYAFNKPFFKGVPVFNFSARFKFKLKFDHDVNLYTSSDDGVRVYINDKLVVNDWNYHAESYNHVSILKKGVIYNIKIEYFQGQGAAAIGLYCTLHKKNQKNKIYLPSGEWFNLSHRNVYQGNRYIKEKYNIEEMPLFIKAGSLLALYKNVDNTSKLSLKNIVYDYYPSRNIVINDYFYEDDGVSTGYKVGIYRLNKYRLEFKDNYYQISLFKSENNLDDNMDIRNALFKMHVRDKEKVIRVTINDEDVRFKRHDHNQNIYPFSHSEWSRDSKTLVFNFKQNIKKDYIIKIYIE